MTRQELRGAASSGTEGGQSFPGTEGQLRAVALMGRGPGRGFGLIFGFNSTTGIVLDVGFGLFFAIGIIISSDRFIGRVDCF